jgi:adenosine deaminase
MRAFLPTPAVPTGHDEFFAAFDKFGAVSGSHFVDMTIDQLRRYDSENVQYVEFMVSSWCPEDRDRFVKAINETTDDASKLKTLEASGLGDCVAARRNVLTAALGKIGTALMRPRRNRDAASPSVTSSRSIATIPRMKCSFRPRSRPR